MYKYVLTSNRYDIARRYRAMDKYNSLKEAKEARTSKSEIIFKVEETDTGCAGSIRELKS